MMGAASVVLSIWILPRYNLIAPWMLVLVALDQSTASTYASIPACRLWNHTRTAHIREAFGVPHGYQSCAVVGSSGWLARERLGAEIDAHDMVMRFNDATLRGFEGLVGTKTTVRMVNTLALNGLFAMHCDEVEAGDDAFCPPYTLAVNSFVKGKTWQADRACGTAGPTRPVNLRDFSDYWEYPIGVLQPHGSNIMSGSLGLAFALALCNRTQVYGVTHDGYRALSAHVPYHYYDTETFNSVVDDLDASSRMLSKFVREQASECVHLHAPTQEELRPLPTQEELSPPGMVTSDTAFDGTKTHTTRICPLFEQYSVSRTWFCEHCMDSRCGEADPGNCAHHDDHRFRYPFGIDWQRCMCACCSVQCDVPDHCANQMRAENPAGAVPVGVGLFLPGAAGLILALACVVRRGRGPAVDVPPTTPAPGVWMHCNREESGAVQRSASSRDIGALAIDASRLH